MTIRALNMAFYPQIKTWKDIISLGIDQENVFVVGAMEFFVVVKVWFKKWLDFDPGINTIGRVCRGGKIVAIRNLFSIG